MPEAIDCEDAKYNPGVKAAVEVPSWPLHDWVFGIGLKKTAFESLRSHGEMS